MSKGIMVLYGYGLDIRTSYGRLKIKHGFPSNGEKIEYLLDKGTNEIEHIIVLGQTGAITFEAINWIVAQNMMITFFDGFGDVITQIAPNNAVPMKIKMAQLRIADDLKYDIIHHILREKFNAQADTVKTVIGGVDISPRMDISKIRDVHKLTVIESTVAAAYWDSLKGIPIKWQDEKKIPQNWKCVNNRKSSKTGNCDMAIDPFNASLNYAYAVTAAMIKLECIKNSIDTDLGLLHCTEKYNDSLIFDLIEPLRGKIDKGILDYFQSKTFTHKDFYETGVGACRISKEVITALVNIAHDLENDVADVVYTFKYMLMHGKPAPQKVCIRCKTDFTPHSSTQKRCCACV